MWSCSARHEGTLVGALAAAALAIAGCAGGGGGGGEGGETTTGTTSAGTDTGSGASGGQTGCGACPQGQVCNGGTCAAPTATLALLLTEDTSATDSEPAIKTPRFVACAYHAAPAPGPVTVPGTCAVVDADAPATSATWIGNAGSISMTSATLGTATIGPQVESDDACQGVTFDSAGPLTASGEVVTFTVSGGSVFPAATLSLAIPPAMSIASDDYQPGEDFEVKWTGSSNGLVTMFLSAVGDDSSSAVQCLVPDTGSFTIPALLTSKLNLTAPATYLYLSRAVAAEQAPSSQPVLVSGSILTADARLFIPGQ